jgi:hypothetical protein
LFDGYPHDKIVWIKGRNFMNETKTERLWMHRLKDVECLYLQPETPRKTAVEYFPCIYIEANIDFNDIRTGYKNTVKLARALKIYENHAVPGWSEEIIHDADIGRIQETLPRTARLRKLPEFVDAEFIDSTKKRYIEYLTRTWKKVLFHNSELNIYSGAGESREEFAVRCREQFLVRMREELKLLRVTFNRMQERLKEKYLGIIEAELPESTSVIPKTTERDVYSRYAECIAAMFLNADSDTALDDADASRIDKKSELEDRFIEIAAEARRKIALLREDFEIKTKFIDEYILRPNLKNIHCERSGLLWAPRKAG